MFQILAAICASLGTMDVGLARGFSSPVGYLVAEKNLTIHLTEEQFSWFSSSVNLGGLVGAIASSFLMKKYGRRGSMLILSFPSIFGWSLLAFGQTFTLLLFGRLCQGFANGVAMAVVPAYIGEISSAKIRGRLSSIYIIFLVSGILYIYTMGIFFKSIQSLSFVCLPVPILFLCTMYILPESPVFLMSKENEIEAEKSVRKLNGKNCDISKELHLLRELTKSKDKKEGAVAHIKMLITPSIYKPLILVCTMFFFTQFTGLIAMLFNLKLIFQTTKTNLSLDLSSIIFISVDLVGCLFAGVLLDKAGRRIVFSVSSIAIATFMGLLGGFFYLKQIDQEWEMWTLKFLFWIPLFCLGSFAIAYGSGVGTIPFVMMGELFRSEAQEISIAICIFFNWFLMFLSTWLFFPLKNLLDDHGLYWLYGSSAIVSFFFGLIFVPETKGKTRNEISIMYSKDNSKKYSESPP